MKPFWPLAAIGMLLGGVAHAQQLHVEGLADLRVVVPSGQESNLDGGLGKLRWGNDDGGAAVRPELGGLVLRGVLDLTPELLVVGEIRSDTQQKTPVDIVDAFVRWRPVSTTRWRWWLKAGAFFPPISLENTGIGWSTEWTLTPSAINAWVGDELRIIGGEAMVEWRGDSDHLQAYGSIFGWNQPAGVALANRGWSFNDRPLGLFDHIRLPDVVAEQREALGQTYHSLFEGEFRQIDRSPGWYAGVAWERPEYGRIALLRYDNRADPAMQSGGQFAWRTKFWSLSASTELAGFVVLSQAMVGSTVITPLPTVSSVTDFWAAYVLAGYERGNWRYAVRFDEFGTSERHPGPTPRLSEQGFAGTAAVTWSPWKWLRVTGEVICIDYTRAQRTLQGVSPHTIETQAQLAARLRF